MTDFVTSVAEIQWPAMPAVYSAGVLALEFQLERTERLSANALDALQSRQLAIVLELAI